eukprot:4168806-Prymnesium_polylepis.1
MGSPRHSSGPERHALQPRPWHRPSIRREARMLTCLPCPVCATLPQRSPKLESSSSLARRGTYGGSIACISSVCQSKSASHADARTCAAGGRSEEGAAAGWTVCGGGASVARRRCSCREGG